MADIKDINNYAHVVGPYTDPATQAIYPEAAFVLGEFTVRTSDKLIRIGRAVYASTEAFEAGALPLGSVQVREFRDAEFDALVAANADLVTQIQVTAMALTQ
jgi:hypothetical protein